MQNRFTVKDFFYMLIGAVVCLLLMANMLKTDNEVVALNKVQEALNKQQGTLSTLGDAITGLKQSQAIDPKTLSQILESARQRPSDVPAEKPKASAAPVAAGASTDPYNAAKLPSYQPRVDNPFPVWASSTNRQGQPQHWAAAPDASLPADFAPGDTLVMSWAVEPRTLTPCLAASDAYSQRIWWLTMDYLVGTDLNAPFSYTPGLAKAWEVSDDGLTLTFHLQEQAVWSDGKPIIAADVIFSWDLVVNPKIDAARVRSYITQNIQSWEAVDSHTVRFTMKQPYFDAVSVCGNLLPIIPRHIYGDYSEEVYNKGISDVLVGSGPYMLESWERTKQVTLTRNENYWGPKPALDKIVIKFITNELSNLQEFWAGNIDLVVPTPEQWTENVQSAKFKERKAKPILFYSPLGGYAYLGYNMRKPCFADKRTRQALTMLIDRRGLINTVMGGLGNETTGPFFINAEQYDKSIEPWPYDPERARKQLAEIGWADTDGDGVIDMDLDGDGKRDPFEITYLMNSGSPLSEKVQRFVQEAFKQGGIKVSLDALEWSVFIERVNEGQFDMITLSWTASPESDPFQIWHSSQAADRGSNRVAYNNPVADRLIELGRRELDHDKRIDIWHQFHRVVHEDQPYTFLYALPTRGFLDQRFQNVQPRDLRVYPQEWYVPAAAQPKHQ